MGSKSLAQRHKATKQSEEAGGTPALQEEALDAERLKTWRLIDELMTPLDRAYGDLEALRRQIQLTDLYELLDADPETAREVAGLCSRSFWAHLSLVTWTHDPKSDIRVKPFSPLRCYMTLADWMDEKTDDGAWAHPKIAITKSRQLMMSWFCIARMDWACIAKPFSECPMISQTDEEAAEILGRVGTIHQNYPRWYRGAMGLSKRTPAPRSGSVRYRNGSKILGLPQRGGNAMRSKVPTIALFDEAAFQESFKKNWTAGLGTANTAFSQIIAITTAAASYFQLVYQDNIDGVQGGRGRIYHEELDLTIWCNRVNGIDCVDFGFLADPGKREAEWLEQASKGLSMDQVRREFFRDYTAATGLPVFRMFDRRAHCMLGRVTITPTGKRGRGIMRIQGDLDDHGRQIERPVRLLRAIDHGTTNYCACVWAAVDADNDWFVYRVYKRKGWLAGPNAQAIAELSGAETYAVDVIDAMQGLPDRRGKVEDIYRDWKAEDGSHPLRTLETVKKGAGSRQEGLDTIGGMLLATLAGVLPAASYWAQENYTPGHQRSFLRHSALYFAPGTEAIIDEIIRARYDEPTGGNPEIDQPETTTKMADDLLDCLRYLVRTGGRWVRDDKELAEAA